jgi:citrate synthase
VFRYRRRLLNYQISTGKDELLETAMALHEAAMKDEYFIKRKLATNVDFWWVFDRCQLGTMLNLISLAEGGNACHFLNL